MKVRCDHRSEYQVAIYPHSQLSSLCSELRLALSDRRCIFVTTPTVHALYKESFFDPLQDVPLRTLVIDGAERAKTFETALSIAEACADQNIDRLGIIVAIGGGSCSDIVGVAASLVRRGITHFRVPTTLVSQIDAAIGLKNAVNFHGKKNYLGAFHPAERVFVCPGILRTLHPKQIREGLSEIVKIALMRDSALFELLERHGEQLINSSFYSPPEAAMATIQLSVEDMLEELQDNPFEKQSFERLVDYGHCFSPLLEAASNYSITHGEAVAIDMSLSIRLAEELGLLPAHLSMRILSLFHRLGLPHRHDSLTLDLCQEALIAAEQHRGGAVNLPLTTDIGRATFVTDRQVITRAMLLKSLDLMASSVELVG